MPSLEDHFHALTKVRPPERWPDLGEREARPIPPPPALRRRIGVAALAFLVAATGFVLAIRALQTERRAPAPSSSVQNGLIAFSRGGSGSGLYVVNPDGTGLMRLPSEPGDTDADWSPDGTRIAFVRFRDGAAGIFAMNADGSGLQQVTDARSDGAPAWSPDGTRLAFAREARAPGSDVANGDIYVVDADGTHVTRLTEDPLQEWAPAWSPVGSDIAFVGWQDASGGQPPSPVRLFVMNSDGTEIRSLGPEDVAEPTWSPDGSEIAFVNTKTGSIMVIHPDGSGEQRVIDVGALVGGVHLVYGPTWSPDGTKIAFMAGPDSTDTHIYVVNRDGSGFTQLTDDSAADAEPAWQAVASGDGTPTPEPTPSPVNPRITATIKVGDFPNAVAVGEGSVWVSVPNNDGTATGQILRIDPATNDIVAEVPIIVIPTWETGGGGLTVGAGSVWVAGSAPARDLGDEPGGGWEAGLLRIDPDTNEVVATVPLGGESGADVAVTSDAAWVLIFSGSNQMSVLRIDPFTDQIIANIPVPGVWGQEILATANGVFVNTRDPYPGLDSTVGASRLTMIDPSTNQIRWTLADTRFVESFQSGAIWAQGGGTKDANVGGKDLLRLDPLTGQTLGDPVPVGGLGGAFAVAPDGGIWFSGSNQQGWTIGRFNSVMATIDASVGTEDFTQDNQWWPTAIAMDPATDTIWLVDYRDNVTRIDLG